MLEHVEWLTPVEALKRRRDEMEEYVESLGLHRERLLGEAAGVTTKRREALEKIQAFDDAIAAMEASP